MSLKPIPKFSSYSIDLNGKVFSHRSNKFIKPGKSGKYLQVVLVSDKGIPTNKRIHRLVAETHIPNPNNYRCVNHIDCNPLNNNSSNLEWVSYQGNTIHAIKSGLSTGKPPINFGEKHHSSKIKQSDIPNIIKLRKSGKTFTQIAKEYSVSHSTIQKIVFRKIWKHVTL